MNRILYLDFAKVICMFWVTAILHLLQYLGDDWDLYLQPWGYNLTWSTLGTFSFIGGLLMGGKQCLSLQDVWSFYKKRIIRFYPLFVLSAILLLGINFITLRQSFYALTGLSPFIPNQPMTLWYISMMVVLYSITPIVLNKKRIVISVAIMLFLLIYRKLSWLDDRFVYNCFLYLAGICIAPYKDTFSKYVSEHKSVYLHTILYILVLVSSLWISNNRYHQIASVLGVPCILCISSYVSGYCNQKVISWLSYVSMSCYLFHRFVYGICLIIYLPDNNYVKIAYLFVVGFSFSLIFAYLVQKVYDYICGLFSRL